MIGILKNSIDRTILKKDINETVFYELCNKLLVKRFNDEEFSGIFKLIIIKLFTWCIYKKETSNAINATNKPYTASEDFQTDIHRIEEFITSHYSSKKNFKDDIMIKVNFQ